MEAACGALRNLSFSADSKAAVARTGVVPLLLALITTHLGNTAALDAICIALRSVTNHSGNHSAAAFAIPVVSELLLRPSCSASASESSCWVLCQLLSHADDRPAAAKASVAALISAVVRHSGVCAVLTACCKALRVALPTGDSDGRPVAEATEIVRAIGAALVRLTIDASDSLGNATALEAACSVMQLLVKDNAECQRIAAELGVPAVLDRFVVNSPGTPAAQASTSLRAILEPARAAASAATVAANAAPTSQEPSIKQPRASESTAASGSGDC